MLIHQWLVEHADYLSVAAIAFSCGMFAEWCRYRRWAK